MTATAVVIVGICVAAYGYAAYCGAQYLGWKHIPKRMRLHHTTPHLRQAWWQPHAACLPAGWVTVYDYSPTLYVVETESGDQFFAQPDEIHWQGVPASV